MAQHWSTFVAVSYKQARALDKMADENGFSDGRELLMELGDYSRSKLSKQDRATVQALVDEAFQTYGR